MPDQTTETCDLMDPHDPHAWSKKTIADTWCLGRVVDHFEDRVVMPGVGKDAEIEVNENGAGQSKIPYAFHLVDGLALGKMAEVLKEGAEKYGAGNWRLLPIEDHLNHLIMHAYAWLAGDRQDDHLSHIMCRAMFAQGVDLQSETS